MSPLLAEISDKVPPLWAGWVIGVGSGCVVFLITRLWKPFAVIGLSLGIFLLNACASEFSGSNPLAIAVREELGRFYVISMVAIPGSLSIIGALLGWHFARVREMRLDPHDGQYHPPHTSAHPHEHGHGHSAAALHGSTHARGASTPQDRHHADASSQHAHRSTPGSQTGHLRKDGRKRP